MAREQCPVCNEWYGALENHLKERAEHGDPNHQREYWRRKEAQEHPSPARSSAGEQPAPRKKVSTMTKDEIKAKLQEDPNFVLPETATDEEKAAYSEAKQELEGGANA